MKLPIRLKATLGGRIQRASTTPAPSGDGPRYTAGAALRFCADVGKRQEPMGIRAFGAEPANEGFNLRVVGRVPWTREVEFDLRLVSPTIRCLGNELTAIIDLDRLRFPAQRHNVCSALTTSSHSGSGLPQSPSTRTCSCRQWPARTGATVEQRIVGEAHAPSFVRAGGQLSPPCRLQTFFRITSDRRCLSSVRSETRRLSRFDRWDACACGAESTGRDPRAGAIHHGRSWPGVRRSRCSTCERTVRRYSYRSLDHGSHGGTFRVDAGCGATAVHCKYEGRR